MVACRRHGAGLVPVLRVYAKLDARAPAGPRGLVGQDGRLDAKRLASKVREFEDMGVDGVLVPDHMFVSPGEERDGLQGYVEPVTLLAAVGAISEKMVLGTIVSNFGIEEPALLCRRFAELAELYGGERVLLGMGAGWNAEEWRARTPLSIFRTGRRP